MDGLAKNFCVPQGPGKPETEARPDGKAASILPMIPLRGLEPRSILTRP